MTYWFGNVNATFWNNWEQHWEDEILVNKQFIVFLLQIIHMSLQNTSRCPQVIFLKLRVLSWYAAPCSLPPTGRLWLHAGGKPVRKKQTKVHLPRSVELQISRWLPLDLSCSSPNGHWRALMPACEVPVHVEKHWRKHTLSGWCEHESRSDRSN